MRALARPTAQSQAGPAAGTATDRGAGPTRQREAQGRPLTQGHPTRCPGCSDTVEAPTAAPNGQHGRQGSRGPAATPGKHAHTTPSCGQPLPAAWPTVCWLSTQGWARVLSRNTQHTQKQGLGCDPEMLHLCDVDSDGGFTCAISGVPKPVNDRKLGLLLGDSDIDNDTPWSTCAAPAAVTILRGGAGTPCHRRRH